MSGDLTRSTLAGLKWTYGSIGASVVLQLGYTAVMGRLLRPADFGLIAMAQVFLRFGSYFAEMGVGPALVQRPELTPSEIRAATTSSVLLGVVFAVALALGAPLGEALFGDSEVVEVIRVLSLTFLVNGAGLTALNLLRRELRFKAIAVVQTTSYVLGYLAVGIGMALAGAGVWSLVGAALSQAALQSALAVLARRHPARPLLRWRELRALYSFGSRVSIISFLEFLGGTVDVLAVGRYSTASSLGQYNRGSLLIVLPFGHLTTGMSRVLFPTFSRIQADRARVRRGYVGAMRLTAAVLAPLAAGMAIAAPELVRVLLGEQWELAATLLPFFAAAAVLSMLSHYGGIVCEALAELNRKLLLQTAFVLLLTVLLWVVRGGPLWRYVAVVAIAEVVRHVLYAWLLSRIVGVSGRDHAGIYLPALLAAAAVGAAVAAVTAPLRAAGIPALPLLAAQVVAGAAALAISLWWGPLTGVRREVQSRLHDAGALTGGWLGGGLDRLLRVGR